MKTRKRPWMATTLALLLGGPGCFYLGWRQGVKATLGWLLGFSFIIVNAKLAEPTVFFIVLLHGFLGGTAYRSCKRSNTDAGRAAGSAVTGTTDQGGMTGKMGRKPLIGWKRAARLSARAVLVVVGGFGLMMVLFFVDLALVDWHYRRLQNSVRPGMTIEEVLHTVDEGGSVNGYPQQLGDEEGHGAHLYGPDRDGTYSHRDLAANRNEELSQDAAATLLQQNMVPGRDYRIGFTFTPGVGPHWSMTVILGPDGKVREVVPFHTWD